MFCHKNSRDFIYKFRNSIKAASFRKSLLYIHLGTIYLSPPPPPVPHEISCDSFPKSPTSTSPHPLSLKSISCLVTGDYKLQVEVD